MPLLLVQGGRRILATFRPRATAGGLDFRASGVALVSLLGTE